MASWLRFLGLGRGASKGAAASAEVSSLQSVLPRELLADPGAHALATLIAAWRWLGVADTTVLAATRAGDLVLEDAAGAVILVDALDGKLRTLSPSCAAFVEAAQSADNQEDWFCAGLVRACAAAGKSPGPGQCLSFKVPPIIGGAVEVANVEVTDLLVHHHVLGQVHEQVKDLPPGTKISGIELVK